MKIRLAALALFCLTLAYPLAAQQSSAASLNEPAMEQELLQLVNQERTREGLPPLRSDPQLTEAARAHSQAMAQHNKLAHDIEGEPGMSQRVAATGLRFNAVAENVSAVAQSPQDEMRPATTAHRGLMGSPLHRANILSPDYNSVGIGVARRGQTYYTTEDFAKSYQAATAAEVTRTVAEAVNALRRRRSMALLRVVPLDRLAAVACGDRTTVQSLLQTFASSRSAAVFTTWQPDDLPQQVRELSQEEGVSAISIHVCAMSASPGGAGGFKVAAVFF